MQPGTPHAASFDFRFFMWAYMKSKLSITSANSPLKCSAMAFFDRMRFLFPMKKSSRSYSDFVSATVFPFATTLFSSRSILMPLFSTTLLAPNSRRLITA